MSHEEFLKIVRAHELESAIPCFPPPNKDGIRLKLLEIGAGTGQQARTLASLGYDVTAIDLPSSHYRELRIFPVIDYDGHCIPCPTESMDIVFSSNVLEHVDGIDKFLDETSRVMTDDGVAIHILPTSSCRNWSLVAHYVWATRRLMAYCAPRSPNSSTPANTPPKRPSGLSQWIATLLPKRHGERGTALTESLFYSESWWKNRFVMHGFRVERTQPNNLFYTMANSLTDKIRLNQRVKLSRYLGSSCRIYILRKEAEKIKT